MTFIENIEFRLTWPDNVVGVNIERLEQTLRQLKNFRNKHIFYNSPWRILKSLFLLTCKFKILESNNWNGVQLREKLCSLKVSRVQYSV